MHTWILLAGGGLFLYFGAEWLVGGASALALRLRVPQLVVGLTVVAFGTSAPEVVVGLQAARDGHGDVALGNVLGSNVANLGLILATAVLIRPTRIDAALRSRELPMLAGTTLVVPLLLWNGAIDGLEGAALVTTALAYTALMVRATLSSPGLAEADVAAAAIDADGEGSYDGETTFEHVEDRDDLLARAEAAASTLLPAVESD